MLLCCGVNSEIELTGASVGLRQQGLNGRNFSMNSWQSYFVNCPALTMEEVLRFPRLLTDPLTRLIWFELFDFQQQETAEILVYCRVYSGLHRIFEAPHLVHLASIGGTVVFSLSEHVHPSLLESSDNVA